MAKKLTENQMEVLAGIVDSESKTYTFEKEVSVEGEKKKGTFTVKYMGVAARLRLGTIRARLLEGAPSQSVDPLTDDIAYMIAYLTVSLVKAPNLWDYDKIDDVSDLREVYMEAYKFMRSFRGQNEQSANAGDSSTSDSKETMENK